MKVRIKKDTVENIALMSLPGMLIAPVSIPLAVLAAVVGGSMLSTQRNDEYEVEVSFKLLTDEMRRQHVDEEEIKRLNSLYWQEQYKKSKERE